MTITRENYHLYKPLIEAWAERKLQQHVRHLTGSGWCDFNPDNMPEFEDSIEDYRRKPELKFRSWRRDEVPVGAQIRDMKNPTEVSIILHAAGSCIRLSNGHFHDLLYVAGYKEFRFAHETEWKQCRVIEG